MAGLTNKAIKISWKSADGKWGSSLWSHIDDAEFTFKGMVESARQTLKNGNNKRQNK